MDGLTAYIKDTLYGLGADLVGIGDLSVLAPDVREGLPIGVCVAVKYPDAVIRGIADLPTQEYFEWYNRLNERLDMLVEKGAQALQAQGHTAIAKTRACVGGYGMDLRTALPHKTVATRAGIGWIGKSALLVTEQYGSMVRLSSILTDAPLEVDIPVERSLCAECMVCTEACPAKAISGRTWEPGLFRDSFFDPNKCIRAAQERSMQGFGGVAEICGKCIEVCPYTQRAWGGATKDVLVS